MEWKCNGWAEEHFHEKLKLPDKVGTKVGRGMVVTLEGKFERRGVLGAIVALRTIPSLSNVSPRPSTPPQNTKAMARECVAIALSPTPYFELGKTYAVHFGASCNLQTVIRRRIPSSNDDHQITDDDNDDPAPTPTTDEAVDTTVPIPHICTPHKFSGY